MLLPPRHILQVFQGSKLSATPAGVWDVVEEQATYASEPMALEQAEEALPACLLSACR